MAFEVLKDVAEIGDFNGVRFVQNSVVPVDHFYNMGNGVYACHAETYEKVMSRPEVKSAAGESSSGNSSLERARDPNWGTF
jgi:hypothetical protein